MSALGNKKVMAENIRRHMDKMGLDRKEFCKRLGFKYSTVTDWLNAEKYPRIDKIEMMANFFNVSKADLVEPYSSTQSNDNTLANNNLESSSSSATTIPNLTPTERTLIKNYRSLSDDGKQLIDMHIEQLRTVLRAYSKE